MMKLNRQIIFCIGVMLLMGQQRVFADNRARTYRDAPASRQWQKGPAVHRPQFGHRAGHRREAAPPSFHRHFSQSRPGRWFKPLPRPRIYSRILVNDAEYFFFDGFFYLPSNRDYVAVVAPIGAIVASLPWLHLSFHWHGQPYYVVGNTFYRRHPKGYIVVPDPGFAYRR